MAVIEGSFGPEAVGASGSGPAEIRLVVVDNRLLFAHSLAAAMAREPGIAVIGVGALSDTLDFLTECEDCIVLVSASERLSALFHTLPEAWTQRRIVVLGDSHDRVLMEQVLSAGVRGIVDQSATLRALVDALRTVEHGQTSIPAHVLDGVVNRSRGARVRAQSKRFADFALSPRELDVLVLLSVGTGTRRIADELFLSISTVRSHIQNILTKLDVHSRLEAVARASELGILAPKSKGE